MVFVNSVFMGLFQWPHKNLPLFQIPSIINLQYLLKRQNQLLPLHHLPA